MNNWSLLAIWTLLLYNSSNWAIVSSQLNNIPPQLQSDYDVLARSWKETSKINDVSPLGVFGASAFAVVEEDQHGTGVAMAGVRLGKGKAIVCGHQVHLHACIK